MGYKDLTLSERVVATHVAFMRDPDFALLAGMCMIGKSTIEADTETAATNGRDKYYGEAFVARLTQQQLRYVVAHENLHCMLRHCTEYTSICEKYPQASNMAMDYCINGMIEELDNGRGFVQRPTDPAPLIDAKYKGRSWLEILQYLLKNPPPKQPESGHGRLGGTLDKHIQSKPGSGEPGAMTEEEGTELAKQVQDAINQGDIIQAKMRGSKAGGAKLSGFTQRKTDWKTPLKRFVQDMCDGDDESRFAPPNRKLQASGFLLPSHFSESTGVLLVAVDTSGSMGSVISVLLGEIARIAQQCQPPEVHVVFWDSAICGAQKFTQKDYAQIGKLLTPVGGGGTRLSVVADWVAKEKLKVKATIILTDTYFESAPRLVPGPILWGVFGRPNWAPPRGKAIYLSPMEM